MDLLSCPNSVPVLCENNGLVELSQFCVGTLDLLSCPNSVSEQWIYWVVPILCWNNVFIELSQFCPNSVLERWIYWAVPILSQFCVGTMDVLSCPNSVLEQWIVSICSNFVLEQWIYWVVPILCWNNGFIELSQFCSNLVLEQWIYWVVPVLSQVCVGTMDLLIWTSESGLGRLRVGSSVRWFVFTLLEYSPPRITDLDWTLCDMYVFGILDAVATRL